jgi:hypothetical protein
MSDAGKKCVAMVNVSFPRRNGAPSSRRAVRRYLACGRDESHDRLEAGGPAARDGGAPSRGVPSPCELQLFVEEIAKADSFGAELLRE